MDDWLRPLPYFIPACRAALDSYFAAHRFRLRESTASDTKVAYSDGRTFVELSYWAEARPCFDPIVAFGIERGYAASASLEAGSIGLWYAIPDDASARHYGEWCFSSAAELEAILPRIRDEVLDVYALSLWSQPDRLAALVQQQREELATQFERETLEKKRREAAAAFNGGRYEHALELYEAIGAEYLTPVEQKRVQIAIRQAAPDAAGEQAG